VIIVGPSWLQESLGMPSSNHSTIERMSLEQLALTEVAKTLTLPLEIPILLDRVLEKIHSVLEPAEVGTVMLWDQSSGLFRSGSSFGYNHEILRRIGLRAGESITGKVYDEGKTSLLATREQVAEAMADMRPANLQVLEQALGARVTPLCAVAAPITVGDSRYGVLILETIHGPEVFHESDLSFIHTLADLIALSIDRARLEARADAIRAAREAEHMRSEVMASLSHELRLPLTAIKGYSPYCGRMSSGGKKNDASSCAWSLMNVTTCRV
jgi:GAF domain-containing protein